MSIVGTRPPLISETNLYEPRHKVTVKDSFKKVLEKCVYKADLFACELPKKSPLNKF